MSWRIAGRYLEACNCEAICPCRRVGGVAVGCSRSPFRSSSAAAAHSPGTSTTRA